MASLRADANAVIEMAIGVRLSLNCMKGAYNSISVSRFPEIPGDGGHIGNLLVPTRADQKYPSTKLRTLRKRQAPCRSSGMIMQRYSAVKFSIEGGYGSTIAKRRKSGPGDKA